MASVWYIGYADVRTISSANWTTLGAPGVTTTWDKTNGWSISQSVLTADQIAYLDSHNEFAVVSSNFPRPGSIVTANVDESVTREDLLELTLADLDDVVLTDPAVGQVLAVTGTAPLTFDTVASSGVGGADDLTVVHKTGDEVIAGVKTFSSPPAVPPDSFSENAIAGLVEDLAAKSDDTNVVHKTGPETIAGVKTFSSAPVVPADAFPESAVTGLTTDLAAKLPKAGGTMTGALTLSGDPVADLQAVTKQYADGLAINGVAAEQPFVYVKSLGAVGNNATDETTLLQDIVNGNAGAIITFEPNKIYLVQQLILPSNTHLNLNGATIRRIINVTGDTNGATIRNLNQGNTSTDVNITVRDGTIDYRADSTGRPWSMNGVTGLRAYNLTIKKTSSTFADFMFHFENCAAVWIDNCRILGGVEVGEDGLHIKSTAGMVVTNCIIESGDDAIVLVHQYGQVRPIKHIAISNCVITSKNANALRLDVYPAETQPIEDVTISNIVIRPPITGNAGGTCITIEDQTDTSLLRRVHLSNFVVNASTYPGNAMSITGMVDSTFSNWRIKGAADRSILVTNSHRLKFTDVVCDTPTGTPGNPQWTITGGCTDIMHIGCEVKDAGIWGWVIDTTGTRDITFIGCRAINIPQPVWQITYAARVSIIGCSVYGGGVPINCDVTNPPSYLKVVSCNFAAYSGGAVITNPPATFEYIGNSDVQNLGSKIGKAAMTGALTLSGAPTADLHAATKLYVDSHAGSDASRFINVLDYGAIGDGVADDTAALNAATAAAKTLNGRKGGTVFLPAGTYLVSAPISIYSSVNLMGEGWSVDNVYYNTSAIQADPGFVGSAIILQNPDGDTVSDPEPRPDESWHWGVIEKLFIYGNGITGPHGIDPGWFGEASIIRNVSVWGCNSAIYLNDTQASATIEAVSLFSNNIGLNCDGVQGVVRVFGISGDNNVNLIRAKGAVSANITVVGMKAENYIAGKGDPVIAITDLAGGAFTLIGGWADTNAARTAVIGITQPGASSQRPKVTVMGLQANGLYTNLINDTYDNHAIPIADAGDFIAYNIDVLARGSSQFNIGYARDITALQSGEADPMYLIGAGSDNSTYFYAGPGAAGGRITNAAGNDLTIQWRKNGNDNLGFFGVEPVTRPNVTGSRGGNAALASLITALTNLGLITDGSSA